MRATSYVLTNRRTTLGPSGFPLLDKNCCYLQNDKHSVCFRHRTFETCLHCNPCYSQIALGQLSWEYRFHRSILLNTQHQHTGSLSQNRASCRFQWCSSMNSVLCEEALCDHPHCPQSIYPQLEHIDVL